MSYYKTLIDASDRAAAKARDRARAAERDMKRAQLASAFDTSQIEIAFLDYDESEIDDMRESATRYAIAH